MQAAIKKVEEARAAWGPDPTEAECEAVWAKYKANPSAFRHTPEELAADNARSDGLRAVDTAALAAAGTTSCRDMGDVLAAIDCVVREDAGELTEDASAILSRCADFLRGEVSRRLPSGQRGEVGFIGCRAVKARVRSPAVVKV